jgi:hypothetical protein
MLSAFRDDYRQALASGFKARPGNSQHGGSRAVGGYGHGRAIDINNIEGGDEQVWHWIDAHGARYGIRRPMPGYDPAHIQAGGDWQRIATSLRESRTHTAAAAPCSAAEVRHACIGAPAPVGDVIGGEAREVPSNSADPSRAPSREYPRRAKLRNALRDPSSDAV